MEQHKQAIRSLKEDAEAEKCIFIEGEYLVIRVDGYENEISLKEIGSPYNILQRAAYLCDMDWATPLIIKHFIEKALDAIKP